MIQGLETRGRKREPGDASAIKPDCGGLSGRPVGGLAAEGFGAVDDAGGEEDHELPAAVAGAAALEQQADQRNIAEERHLVEVAAGVAGEDTADDGGVSVEHEQVRFGLTLQDGWI